MVKRLTIILLIILGVFISFSLYRTYAYNTTVVEDTPSTTDLEYTFKIGNSSIKEITISSGETKYYDVVMGNPNNAKISYSIYYEMVSPSTKPDGFSIEYTSKSTGDSTGKVDKNGNITLNLVVTNISSSFVTVKLGSLAGYVNGGELILSSGQEVIPKKPANFVETLDDGTTGDSGSGVYKIEHDAISASSSATGIEIPAVTDYRYYGASPNNYVCLDNSNGTCEDRHLYRIIGSIYEELSGQNLLKVIKATPLVNGNSTSYAWDSGGNAVWATITSGNYSNSLTSGSSLMKLLNSGDWWNNSNNFINYGLANKIKGMINKSRYYLGGINFNNFNTLTVPIYGYERGIYRLDVSRPLYWDGNVGLMYPSDYGYASGNTCATGSYLYSNSEECKNKNWLYNSNNGRWLIMPGNSSFEAWHLSSNGSVEFSEVDGYSFVYPTFYLKPTTSISSGDGSSSNPYIIQ